MAGRPPSKREMQRRADLRLKSAELRRMDAVRALEARRTAKTEEDAKTARLRALRLGKLIEPKE